MMHLHTGNRLETLADALIDAEQTAELPPLAPRTLICESPGLWRWLRQRFCLRTGIACLLDTRLPAGWLWAQARRSLELPPGDDPLDRTHLHWRVFAVLEPGNAFWSDDATRPLATYLADDHDSLKRWQLSGRIADVFDRYQYYRPNLIRDWNAGRESTADGWQARLWRHLTDGLDNHRIALMDRFLAELAGGRVPHLPPRLDLFAIHNPAPLLLEAFVAIARHIPVHLWLLSPTPEYWADLESPREAARRRRESPTPDDLTLWNSESGNPLLTQWGRQGQALQDLLLDEGIPLQEDDSHFREPDGNSLLHRLQADIFRAVDEPAPPEPLDAEPDPPSIQFHVCHGPLREVQVLHDTLLHLLNADPDLQPEDILVLVPEISRYAPAIEATFGVARGSNALPFNLSDVVRSEEHPLIRAFLDLLQLPESRFTRAELLSLLRIPELRRRFGLDADDIGELADLFERLRICWGLDGKQKTALGLPAIDDNTWHQGFQRAMAGYATGSDALFDTEPPIAPLERLTAKSVQPLARLLDLLDTLRRWAGELQAPALPAAWAERLNRLLDALFLPQDEEGRLAHIRQTLGELARAETGEAVVSLAVIRHWLTGELGEDREQGRLYSGGITFCGMKPLRGVPFRVICLLGMQETAFPRRRRDTEFDRMRNNWRHGDPDPVLEDRYLFLETLLACRERLIISYTGRDARSNEPLQPSVVVQELLDHLDARYRLGSEPPSKALTRIHPLQPFGPANFRPPMTNSASGLHLGPGFNSHWLAMARAIVEHRPAERRSGWPAASLPQPEQEDHRITPQELARFFKDPVKQFVQTRLRVFKPEDAALVEEEPFDLDHLEKWTIRDLLLDNWLQGGNAQEGRHRVRAHGLLPHGAAGEKLLDAIEAEIKDMAARATKHDIEPPLRKRPLDIDLPLTVDGQRWHLSGRLELCHEDHGLLHISASKYKPRNLLTLWIEHLCHHATGHEPARSLFIGQDKNALFHPLDDNVAREHLATLIAWLQKGMKRPLPLPPRSTDAFATSNKLKNTESTWKTNQNSTGYEDDFFIRLALRHHRWQPDCDEKFVEAATTIFQPMMDNLKQKEDT